MIISWRRSVSLWRIHINLTNADQWLSIQNLLQLIDYISTNHFNPFTDKSKDLKKFLSSFNSPSWTFRLASSLLLLIRRLLIIDAWHLLQPVANFLHLLSALFLDKRVQIIPEIAFAHRSRLQSATLESSNRNESFLFAPLQNTNMNNRKHEPNKLKPILTYFLRYK